MVDPAVRDLMTSLATQEECIASLYEAFSKAVPEMEQFWSALVVQELAHEEVLRMIVKLYEDGKLSLEKSVFTTAAVNTNIDMIKKRVAQVEKEGTTPIRALSLAADIEHSLIEAGYFRIIKPNTADSANELAELESHTKQHIALVETKLNELRVMP